jgi:hypothetical protein
MAKKKGSTKQPRVSGKKTRARQEVSMSNVHKIKENSKQKHLRAAQTRQNYTGHVRRGREWMTSHFAEAVEDTFDDTTKSRFSSGQADAEDSIYNEPDFKQALDGTPTKYSDKALALLISYKCFYENLGLSTCDGIYSAFKRYWEELWVELYYANEQSQLTLHPLLSDGDTYRGKWLYHDSHNRWEGNPAESAEVQDIRTAVRHKTGADGSDRTHLLAMSKEYMDQILTWSENECPEDAYSEEAKKTMSMDDQMKLTTHLEYRAFASTAWIIWSRYVI